MFSDRARVFIKGGDGGDGAVTFHREKYVAAGGPDGGDGGRGGSVIFVADKNVNTLIDFRYRRKFKAENGGPGRDANRYGKNGEDLRVPVPVGTIVRDEESGLVICDLKEEGEEFVVAKGGIGGWGNKRFATATRQVPRFAKPGNPGDERYVTLELKLIADVGLLGFPNVGKSTFLSIVSDARPKIANYHFTTLEPNLGVVNMGDGSFVVADIPGIIEGAHEGVGLGHEFLRHVERTKLLLHVVDVSGIEGRDPIEDFDTINRELALHSEKLAKKRQIVLANKCDIPGFDENFEIFKQEMESRGLKVFKISAATKRGIDEVLKYTYEELSKIPPEEFEEEYEMFDMEAERKADETITVTRDEDGVYHVEGRKAFLIVGSTNLDDYESLQYFQRALIKSGIIDKLKEAGVKNGDPVEIYDCEFDYVE